MRSYEFLKVRIDDAVGTIVLNRPTVRNALSRAMIDEFAAALEEMHAEREVRGVVLAAAGADFCSGLDLREMHDAARNVDSAARWHEDVERFRELLDQLIRYPKPLVACVQGVAAGAALALVAATDLCLVDSTARFNAPETRRGLAPGLAAPLLTFRVGGGAAARLLVMGQTWDADEAVRVGLAAEVVADERLWARAADCIREAAHGAPQAVQFARRVLNELIGESWLEGSAAAAAMSAAARTTPSAEEGLNAFVEKRAPKWP